MHTLLTTTDLFMLRALGSVQRSASGLVARTPDNPGYRWGNFLLLDDPPSAQRLDALVAEAQAAFADDPRVEHVCLRWDGPALDPATQEAARALGMTEDLGLAMEATALPPPARDDLTLRPLTLEELDGAWARDAAWDPSEDDEFDNFARFKRSLRAGWTRLVEHGAATWWEAFEGDEVIGQCGMVLHPEGRWGRYQQVQTKPQRRRRGVCSSLVPAVGRDAFARGAARVLLGADPEGPALSLYRRLGFRDAGWQRALVMGASPPSVRPERPGDRAEVRAITLAAFGQPGEAALVEALRERPGAISLVADRDGHLLGHALFSVVTAQGPDGAPKTGIALGPISVRPTEQGQGVGGALIREGLRLAAERGHSVAVVLGDPAYYGRFGWQPASRWGLRCKWEGTAEAFQAMELAPGGLADWTGLVSYDPAFDAVT